MVQPKEVMERNIHTCDKDVKWQLAGDIDEHKDILG